MLAFSFILSFLLFSFHSCKTLPPALQSNGSRWQKKSVFERKQRRLKWLNRGRLKKKTERRREGEIKERWREWQSNPFPLLFLMMRLEDPGEPLTLIDVKCVISLLIKAET